MRRFSRGGSVISDASPASGSSANVDLLDPLRLSAALFVRRPVMLGGALRDFFSTRETITEVSPPEGESAFMREAEVYFSLE